VNGERRTVNRSTGVQEYRSTGVQEYRSTGVQEYRRGKSEYRSQNTEVGNTLLATETGN
jgi:hypothetical protein